MQIDVILLVALVDEEGLIVVEWACLPCLIRPLFSLLTAVACAKEQALGVVPSARATAVLVVALLSKNLLIFVRKLLLGSGYLLRVLADKALHQTRFFFFLY